MNKIFSLESLQKYILLIIIPLCIIEPGYAQSIQHADSTIAFDRAYAISDDGTVIGGESSINAGFALPQGYIWNDTTGANPTGNLGFSSHVWGLSLDGSTAVGESVNGSFQTEAFRWTSGSGMVGLGDLPGGGFVSRATSVSGDGSIVVGQGTSASGTEAFRWTSGSGMVGLGDLPGGIFESAATAISTDGTTIVGNSKSASGTEAFRWESGVMTGLGFLPGGSNISSAFDVNANGTVIVGSSRSLSSGIDQEAFRWTSGSGMVGLGDLPGGSFSSFAYGVNGIGDTVVGISIGNSGVYEAFIWTQSSGIEPLKDVLTSKGVDMTNWVIDSAEDISADGTLIVGRAKLSGQQKAYIANLASAGITTPESLSTSLYGVSKIAQQVSTYANYYNQQGLFLSRHISELSVPISSSSLNKASYLNSMKPAAGNEAIPIITKRNLSTFALGGYGVGNNNDFDNNEWSGIAGINLTLDGNKSLSLGIIKGQSIYDIDSDGSSVLSTLGAIGTITYTPKQSNIRIYGTVFGVNLELDTNRGYINGSGLDFSKGSTEGFSYGSATRLGWEMSLPNNITIIMPYIEGHYSRTKINGYQENGGAFSANFTELDSENISSHVGIEINQEITPTLELIVRSAWGHKVSGEEGQITANVSGIMQNMNWDAGNTNWAETTIGASWEATPDLHIATEVTGRSGSVSQPAAHINIGAKYKF